MMQQDKSKMDRQNLGGGCINLKYINKKPIYPLHGTMHYMSSCKGMQVKAKSMRTTWPSDCVGGGDHVNSRALRSTWMAAMS